MTIPQYLTTLNQRFRAGNATEHTFRGDLQQLLESLCPGIQATNEPKRQACGAPDYILTRNDIPVGYIEANKIGGYQPAQKWLKDRKGRTLSFDDLLHYQKIIVALTETARLMEEIDGVGVE